MDIATTIGGAYTALQFIRDAMTLALGAKIDAEARGQIAAAMEKVIQLKMVSFRRSSASLGYRP